MIKNWKKSIISEKATLSQAIKAISSNKLKVAVVVSQKKTVLGLLTTGDIRRAIVNEKNLKSKSLDVATQNPLIIPNNVNYEKIKLATLSFVVQIFIIFAKLIKDISISFISFSILSISTISYLSGVTINIETSTALSLYFSLRAFL